MGRLGNWSCALLALTCAVTATAQDTTGRELVSATLWMQVAPEYRAQALQTYRLAGARLATRTEGSAALEQQGMDPAALARLPTAVILDLDETVLDNTVFQARLLRDRATYNPDNWGAWVSEGVAEAVPGASEYIAAARQLGHTVFYITNRDCGVPASTANDPCPAQTTTIRNLLALGIDTVADPDRLMLRGERAEWNQSNKSVRRAAVAANYRIVALVGDDLGDFVDPTHFAGDRQRLEAHFGADWFMLPNPIYGSWMAPYPSVESKYAGLHTEPAPLALPGVGPWDPGSRRIRVATWNVEYLLTPETARALRGDCAAQGSLVAGDERLLPCAISRREPRTAADYASLRGYAADLRADVVALQEVDGPDAAALVFPGYDYCFSTRAHVQKNGFAIRRGVPFRCEPEYLPLSLQDAQRRGVVLTLFPGTHDEFRLMSVHLKSGCPAGPLTNTENSSCDVLARQVEPLEQWIDAEARAGSAFGVLGDFNRRFSLERGPARDSQGRQVNVFREIDDRDPSGARITDVTAGRRFVGCTTESSFREYIDTILLGAKLAGRVARKSFVRVKFRDADASQRWLSDHCPVGIEIALR